MRKVIDIPDEIVKDLQHKAVESERDLKNYIQDLLKAEVSTKCPNCGSINLVHREFQCVDCDEWGQY